MNLIACGINHKTASLAMRERVVFSRENTPSILRDLLSSGVANEAVILSTCNRTEIYTHTTNSHGLVHWLSNHPQTTALHHKHWYWHQNQQAVSHIMRVASGLDSMVIGEPQILGQMKQAFELAQQTGTVGSQLHRLLQRVFAVTKHIRSHTGIGANPISIAYAAVTLAKRVYSQLSKCQVLLVGSGQMIELATLHLSDCGVKRITVANRSLSKANRIATQFNGNAIALADVPLYLQTADIVISATASNLPIIDKGMVERALKSCKRRPLLMIDLAVPRDIEPAVAQLEDVYLYNMDNLQEIVQENLKSRYESAHCAEQMVDIQARYFMRQLQATSAVDTIKAYREKMEGLCQEAVIKAQMALEKGGDPQQVVREMAVTMTNKIMHTPTARMRQAGFDGQAEVLVLVRKLFDI